MSRTWLSGTATGLRFSGRVQSLSLIEEIPSLDIDGDGLLSERECQSGRTPIVTCLAQGYFFGNPGLSAHPVGAPTIRILPRTTDGFGMPELQLIQVEWDAQWPQGVGPEGRIDLANRLFEQTSPGHQDVLTFQFGALEPTTGKWIAGAPARTIWLGVETNPGFAQQVGGAAWQEGGGLGLVFALLCWVLGRKGRWVIHGAHAGAWFMVAALSTGFGLRHLPVVGPAGNWFLPVALVYILADARLGGGLLRSPLALVLWGASFAVGLASSPSLEPGFRGTWDVAILACLAPVAVAIALRSLVGSLSEEWGMRLAWIGVGAVFLVRAIGRFA
ncbi:MAG: hypothetical protein GY930_15985 [bacterium]|nr:hypothetical protein [bacterium]